MGDLTEFGKTVTVRRGMITIQDQYVNNGIAITFFAEIYTEGGTRIHLEEGRKYRVVINPFADTELIVLDEDGRILGIAPEYTRANPLDENYYKHIGRIEARKAERNAKQHARYEGDNLQVIARRERNRAIAEEGGVTRLSTAKQKNLPAATTVQTVRNTTAPVVQDVFGDSPITFFNTSKEADDVFGTTPEIDPFNPLNP